MHLTTRTWRYLLLITFLLVPVANYLPILLGISQDQFTDGIATRIDAAGYGFSIWGVIFAGMIVFAALQLRNPGKTKPLKRAYKFLVLAGLASIAFVPISLGDNQLIGWVDLLWHLLALIGAYLALREHTELMHQLHYGWSYFAPSMYLGWISAATVISTALALHQLGITFAPAEAVYIALALIVVLTALGVYLGLRRDGIYAFTVAWALVAVAVEQQDAPLLLWGGVAGAGLLGVIAGRRLVGRAEFFYAA